MADGRKCPKCGQVIPREETECPFCAEQKSFLWSLGRNSFLLLTFLALALLFVFTGFAAKAYHAKEKALAEEWQRRGEEDLRAGRAPAALEDFRNALAYSSSNSMLRLHLAEALVAAGRPEEARAYLLSLWEEEPGDGTINMELAHLAVREGSVPDAVRYFQNAIYGEWGGDAARRRREARMQLADFLLGAGRKAEAQADLIALAPDLPNDPALQSQVGRLLMRAGSYEQALPLFLQALRLDPHRAPALEGTGQAYYELANYREAERYLARAVAADPHLAEASARLETARLILGIDPFARRLSAQERTSRALRAFEQATARLRSCATQRGIILEDPEGETDLQKAYAAWLQLNPQARERNLLRDPELLQSVMEWAFDTERIAERDCGEPQGLDQALLLLAGAQGGARP